ncbi:MAG: substrate-binding domain-containing protein [Christensenellaceae bacterium]|nr:substrate-binding domain-containing protein [Christensenellaceae bacterium]
MLKNIFKKAFVAICLLIAATSIYLSFNTLIETNSYNPPAKRIALILNSYVGQHGVVVKQGAILAAKENKAELTVFTPYSDLDLEVFQLSRIDEIIAEKFDGVLLMSCGSNRILEAIEKLENNKIEVISLDVPIDGCTGPYVGTNHELSGTMLIESLLNHEQDIKSIVIVEDSMATEASKIIAEYRLKGIYKGLENKKTDIKKIKFTDIDQLRDEINALDDTVAIVSMDSILTENIALLKNNGNKNFNIYGFDSNQMHLNLLYEKLVKQELIRDSLAIGYRATNNLIAKINGTKIDNIDYIKAYMVNVDLLKYNKYATLLYPISVE